MKNELEEHLKNIQWAQVKYSRAGGGAGPIISMELYDANGSLYILWVECDWRIENKNKIVATSADNSAPVTSLVAQSVKLLEGKIIESIQLSPFYDLSIYFVDGFCLNVFCIFSYDYEFETNWYLALPKQNLSLEVTNYFNVRKGTYY